jgi:hypothetical protein
MKFHKPKGMINIGLSDERLVVVAVHVLYHFDRVFRILEIYLSEKAENISFGLWRFLNKTVLFFGCDA